MYEFKLPLQTVYINPNRKLKIFINDIGNYAINYTIFYYNNEISKTRYTTEARQVINTRRIIIEEILRQSFKDGIDLKTPILHTNTTQDEQYRAKSLKEITEEL